MASLRDYPLIADESPDEAEVATMTSLWNYAKAFDTFADAIFAVRLLLPKATETASRPFGRSHDVLPGDDKQLSVEP